MKQSYIHISGVANTVYLLKLIPRDKSSQLYHNKLANT